MAGEYRSLNYFLGELMYHTQDLNANDWNVTSLGSGRDSNDNWNWIIHLKNKKTEEEKNIQIPCYKD